MNILQHILMAVMFLVRTVRLEMCSLVLFFIPGCFLFSSGGLIKYSIMPWEWRRYMGTTQRVPTVAITSRKVVKHIKSDHPKIRLFVVNVKDSYQAQNVCRGRVLFQRRTLNFWNVETWFLSRWGSAFARDLVAHGQSRLTCWSLFGPLQIRWSWF